MNTNSTPTSSIYLCMMNKTDHIVYILLGGNLQNIKHTFELAIEQINKEAGTVKSLSYLYKSKAWGFESQNDFLNQVIEISTKLNPETLLNSLLSIETNLGRVREANAIGFSSRIIDIDLLYFDNDLIQSDNLTIPHYAIQDRLFTLLPLNDIIPNYLHPKLQLTNAQLLENCTDTNIPERL